MFYLSGRGNLSGDPKNDNEDEFGWYLVDREIIEDKIYDNTPKILRSPVKSTNRMRTTINRTSSSLKSKIIIFTSNDNDDKSTNYSISSVYEKRKNYEKDFTEPEYIEMNQLNKCSSNDNEEIDLESIEKDADHAVFTSSIVSSGESENNVESNDDDEESLNYSRGICYTPERLVRSQEYRILTPSPRYLSIPRSTANVLGDTTKTRNYRDIRRKIGDFIDAKQIGSSQLEALLDSGAPEIRLPVTNRRRTNRSDRTIMKKNVNSHNNTLETYEPLEIANREIPIKFKTPDFPSSRSSYERLDGSSCDERSKIIRRSSQDDTSGIHSNDWSTDTPSDVQMPICLCDELATASGNFVGVIESRSRTTAINEVVSILEDLERDPDRAAVLLLEEDRFCDVTSGHDNLTRLALAIEPDGSVPTVNVEPDNIVDELRDKVERLQESTRSILKDIVVLRRDFECNENKVDDLIDETVTLRQDTNEMRYLDDLLNLLDGELERITRRNWPFVFGHSEHRGEDMNLVV